jgi:uncharacterized protein (DUF362 family)
MATSPSTVAVVRGARGHTPVFAALDLIDFARVFAERERVLIKVNFITDKPWDTGATTDPIVVEAIIRRLQRLPVEIQVVESDATGTNADRAFERTGMKAMCDRNGVECLNLRRLRDKVTLPIPDGETLRTISVPRLVAETPIISAAKLKTHTETGVTLGMKNMFGLLPDKFKAKYHLRGMHNVVVDVSTVLRPAVTVIDGFVGMEGRGPVRGTPVRMDLILAGTDPVATDATACRVMGIDPHEIRYIQRAHEKGFGRIDAVDVLGARLADVTRVFKR